MAKPDYTLKIKARDGGYATRVGAAWRTRSGDGINIRIDPGVSISSIDGVDITLWPYEERRQGGGGGGGNYQPRSAGSRDDFGEDEIPFCSCSADDASRLLAKVRV